jgi:hypothetical protein
MAAVVKYSQEKLDSINRNKEIRGLSDQRKVNQRHKKKMEVKVVQGVM